MSLKQRKPVEHKDMAAMKAYHAKLNARPPVTDLQKLAQKENFALFILTGMLGNSNHLREIDSSDMLRLQYYIKQSIARIKSRQNSRIANRKNK